MFWFDNYGQEYDTLVYELGEEEAFARYSQQKDKFVMVEAREDGATRLFVQSLFSIENAERKNGWWNTFTICEQPQKAGTYIAKIVNVRKDKKGYPNFVATPICELDVAAICYKESMWETHKRKSALMSLFVCSGLFTEYHANYLSGMGFNMNALGEEFGMMVNRSSYDQICHAAMFEVIYYGGDLKKIIDLMLSPTRAELMKAAITEKLQEFFDNRSSLAAGYPNLVRKLNRMVELDSAFGVRYHIYDTMHLFDIDYEGAVYNKHIQPVNGDIIDRVEAYMKFYYERKAESSKKKTAAKKAKKAAAKKAAAEAKANNT